MPSGNIGDNRPGIPGGNRPGVPGNRPGLGSGNTINIGSGNNVHNGDNLGVVNRPDHGGNWGLGGGNNTTVINNNVNNINTNIHVNNGFGGGGFRPGRNAPLYGNWYRGGWGNNSSFWTGFGAGALTSFGLSALAGGARYASAPPVYVSTYFPMWGAGNFTTWGLGPYVSSSIYGGYANPYNAMVVAAQPAQGPVSFDYSQPINVTAAATEPAGADNNEQVFSAARDAFKAGDYKRALELTDLVLKQMPDSAVVHEFRALCLFALGRYDEASAVNYAVLSAGPGWNWSTMVGLYPDVDTYTAQLRALEAYLQTNPNSAPAAFLLAYHYLAQGNNDAAGAQFERVSQLLPSDQLSASFAKLYKKAAEATATAPPVAGAGSPPAAAVPAQGAELTEQPDQADQPPPPPPASLVGVWKAQPSPEIAIALTLQQDGQFAWDVSTKGQTQSLTGVAGYKDSTLALLQQDGPPLVGKLTQQGPNTFVFAPDGAGDKAGGLTFTR